MQLSDEAKKSFEWTAAENETMARHLEEAASRHFEGRVDVGLAILLMARAAGLRAEAQCLREMLSRYG